MLPDTFNPNIRVPSQARRESYKDNSHTCPVKVTKMAFSPDLSAIKKQLECSICCETIQEPKILESCNHVFCKKCISDLIKLKKYQKVFPCPECRVLCTIPSGGVDGLTDDARVATLVGILNNAPEKTKPERILKCSLCTGQDRADSVCDLCDLDLCKNCRWQHHKEDCDHVIYDLCETHGRRMKHYCYKCNKIICVLCYQRDHSAEDHDTGPYEDFAANNHTSLAKQIEETSTRANITQERIEKVELRITQVQLKYNAIIDESHAAIESLTSETNDIRKEIEALQIRLQQLETEKATRTEDKESQIQEIDSQNINLFEAEACMVILSEKVELLEIMKPQLVSLASNYFLGDAHHKEVVESKHKLEDAESAFVDIENSLDEIERNASSLDVYLYSWLIFIFWVIY